jgi:hypothetical protein
MSTKFPAPGPTEKSPQSPLTRSRSKQNLGGVGESALSGQGVKSDVPRRPKRFSGLAFPVASLGSTEEPFMHGPSSHFVVAVI